MPTLQEDQDKKYNPAEERWSGGSTAPGSPLEDLGVHPERREAEVDDMEKLLKAESAPETKTDSSKAESEEAASISETSSQSDDGDWDTKGLDPKKSKFRINRRKAAVGGGVAGVLVGGSIGFFGFISGPLQFIHFAQNLQMFHFSDDSGFSNSRTGKLFRWARTRSTPEDRNLSKLGTKIAKHYETKLAKNGIDIEYNNRRMSRMRVDPNTDAGSRFIKSIEAEYGGGFPKNMYDADGKLKLDFAVDSSEITTAEGRRIAINGAVDAMEMNGVSGALSKRMLKLRARVDLHPLRNFTLKQDEKFNLKLKEWKAKRKEDRIKSIKEGADPPDIGETKRTQDPNKPASPEDAATTTQLEGESAEIEKIAKDPKVPMNERIQGVKAKLKTGVGVAAVVGAVCGLKQLGDSAADLQESNVVKPLIRTGTLIISSGSQIMTGQDVSMAELGEISKSFYDEKTGTSWSSAESIQAEWGNPNTGVPMQDSAKPGKDKPQFFKIVDVIATPFAPFCSVINTTIGGIASTVAGIAVTYSGPWGIALEGASMVGQQILSNAFMDDVVRWLAGEAVDFANATGGTLGNYANFGAFLASNDAMRGLGGRALTKGERMSLKTDQQKRLKQEMKHKSMYARILSPVEPNSLFAKTVLEKPQFVSVQSTVASAITMPSNIFNLLSSSLKSLIPGVSAAEVSNYDYGVDQYGFSLEEMNNAELDDPYKNADYVENNLDLVKLNEDFGKKCLGTTVDPSTGKISYTESPTYKELEKRKSTCTDKSQDILRYRMYVADSVNMATVECYESLDESACDTLGVGSVKAESPGANEASTDAVVVGDTSNLTCGAGTDAGVGDGYSNNQLYKIRLCDVQGITVNAQIAQNLDKLLNDARAAGIPLGGSGFRTMQSQISLRSSNHCPDTYNAPASSCGTPTARPGYSNHQMGLAIDFQQGGSTLRRSHSGFGWMATNASKYGLKNLPSETWHWSVDGH